MLFNPISLPFTSTDKYPKHIVNSILDAGTAKSNLRLALNAKDDDSPIEILMFEAIGDFGFGEGVSPTDIVETLAKFPKRDVVARLNSPGGLAFDGITIFNSLAMHEGHVTTRIEGLAASAAGLIFQAGDRREMQANSSLMIHRALVGVIGNAQVLRAVADELDVLDNSIAVSIADRSGLDQDDVMELLIGDVDGTTLGAEDAVDLGLADVVLETKKPGKKKNVRQAVENAYELEIKTRIQMLDLDRKRFGDK